MNNQGLTQYVKVEKKDGLAYQIFSSWQNQTHVYQKYILKHGPVNLRDCIRFLHSVTFQKTNLETAPAKYIMAKITSEQNKNN